VYEALSIQRLSWLASKHGDGARLELWFQAAYLCGKGRAELDLDRSKPLDNAHRSTSDGADQSTSVPEGGMTIRPLSLLDFFVAIVMFSIGLRVCGGELLDVWQKRGLFARMLLANCILIPAMGFFLVHEFPLNPEARIGILLLAAIPGTPIALQFTRQAKRGWPSQLP